MCEIRPVSPAMAIHPRIQQRREDIAWERAALSAQRELSRNKEKQLQNLKIRMEQERWARARANSVYLAQKYGAES